jgi:hypothetical protein
MRGTLRGAGLVLLAALAGLGCAREKTSVLVLELTAEGSFAATRVVVTLPGVQRTYDGVFPKSDGTPLRLGLAELPGSLGQTTSVDVKALDAGGCAVASGSQIVTLIPGSVATAGMIVRRLAAPDCQMAPDGGPGPITDGGSGGTETIGGADAGDLRPPEDRPAADVPPDGARDAADAPAAAVDARLDAAVDVVGIEAGAPKRANGESCLAGGDCVSNLCADGVCCNAPCQGQCQTCNGPGTMGTCLPISGDPQGGRPPCAGAGTTCGGTCNGTVGATCIYPQADRTCGAASCSNAVAQPAPACDGKGACVMPAPVNCAPNGCAGNACAGGCSDTSPCAGDNYCEAGKCMPKLAAGVACRTGTQCTSGACADGVCCNNSCPGECESCNLAGKVGTCSPQTGTVCRESRGQCDPAEVCSGSGGSCPADQRHSASFVCRPAAGLCDEAETCNGSSDNCPADLLKPGNTVCRTVAGLCDVEDRCSGSSSACPDTLKGNGESCRPATGVCDLSESCNGVSPACPTDQFASNTTPCGGTPGCNGNTFTPAMTCNGSGTCAGGTPQDCSPYKCAANGCTTMCVGDNDCAAGNGCNFQSKCVPANGTWTDFMWTPSGGSPGSPPTGSCVPGRSVYLDPQNEGAGWECSVTRTPSGDSQCTSTFFYTAVMNVDGMRRCGSAGGVELVSRSSGGVCLPVNTTQAWVQCGNYGLLSTCPSQTKVVSRWYFCLQ